MKGKTMKLNRTLAALTVTAVAGLGLTACAGGAEAGDGGDGVTVTVVTPYLANAATKEAIDLFTAEGEERGWTVSVVDTAGDMNKLNSAFQDAAAQQPDAIVLGTGDPTQISLGLKAAADADVPVFAIDAGAADGIAANVTSDNVDLGQQSANALIEAMGGSGSVVMLTHDPHPGVRARAEGAREVFQAAGIEIVEEKHVNVPGPVDDARTSVQDVISARGGDVTGIWGGWDEPALGAVQALQAAGVSDIPVVGVDGQDFALAEIEKGGPFVATVKQDWAAIVVQVADLIGDYVEDGTEPEQGQYELPGTLVTQP
ncbi:substrate-binding domain-containing protein [Microbacterium lushaniae]|uniref:Substrate-binding domain-containing protein n=2 Tax=Microbacterium lushaniae TaxID=2614639 RepID=A0A5J5JB29_9MICO|nr:substrate-binding domain-containing protein [Microbacterium lushaniae]KAA9149381.1 substrate-binding domain-containing protein [Microbacterium lushaniae]QEW01677.1 substrate-binding domain-containing protein [Microbacterium lushaniae]